MIVTAPRAARLLGLPERQVRQLMQLGYIRSRYFGTEIRTSQAALDHFTHSLFTCSDIGAIDIATPISHLIIHASLCTNQE